MRWVKQIVRCVPLSSIILIGLITQSGNAVLPTAGEVSGGGIVEIKLGQPQESWPTQGSASAPATTVAPKPTDVTTSPQPPYPTFNSQQLDRQLQLYLTYLAEFGPPDILIVGSSRSLQGIDPAVLQQTLAQQGYPNLKVFNFGINGATAQVVDWLLQQLLTPEQLPRLILWGDGSRAFNQGRPDHTFNNILTSQGHKLLASGIRPVVPPTNRLELGRICMDLLPLQFPLQEPFPTSIFPIPITPRTAVKSLSCNQPLKFLIRPGVVSPMRPYQPRKFAESLGFQWVNAQFNPASYFRQYPKVSGRFDADYRNFSLQGEQIRALEKVARFANHHQIPLVVVNLPLTPTYLDASRTGYENQFSRRMRNVARSQGFIFQDLVGERSLSYNHYFADPSHINRYGAAAIATHLSQTLTPSLSKLLQGETNSSEDTKQVSLSRFDQQWLCLLTCTGSRD